MSAIISLWLPVLLSAAAVFIVSSIIHMLLGYHNTDFKKLPNEDQVASDLGKHNIPPGDYVMPYASNNKERNTPEYKDKMSKGPVAFMTVLPAGEFKMGGSLLMWFIYCIIVGIFAAYVVGRAYSPWMGYLEIFKFAAVTSFAGYGLALMQDSIWFKKNWGATIKSMFDALVYALVTGGIFGWLRPV